jgi:hypothetical protein
LSILPGFWPATGEYRLGQNFFFMSDAEKIYQFMESVVREFKDTMPTHFAGPLSASNPNLPPDVRTRLAFLDDMQRRALALLGKGEDWEKGFPPLRPHHEIQRAHDTFWAIVMQEVPSPYGPDPEAAKMCNVALNTLCYCLNHDHGPEDGFKQNLQAAHEWLAERGFIAGADPVRAAKEREEKERRQ